MDAFHAIVLVLAGVFLLICLTLVWMVVRKKREQWPPMVPSCPDYWDITADGVCVNKKDLGKCPPRPGERHLTMDFNVYPFNGANSQCAKYTWASTCGVAWDGLTYGAGNPCDTTEPTTTSAS
jgi:hypothetical protein